MQEISEPSWELYPHDADIGVRGYGKTIAKAFENAALALTSAITNLEKVRPTEGPLSIVCEAPDMSILFVDWLNAIIFEMSERDMLFSRFEVAINDHRLEAKLWGERLDITYHQPAVEIKGATFTTLKVEKQPDGQWLAQCVVDV